MGDGIKRPPDGNGVKWSTLKRKTRRITLENGQTEDMPVFLDPFGPGTPLYGGYEVELEKEVTVGGEKVSKIQVWVLVSDPPPPNGRVDWRGWCHGLTFDDTIYSPLGNAVPAILAAGWVQIEDCKEAKKGDIVVYRDANGNVTHTAIANGDGTYTSKGGNTKEKKDETLDGMDRTYRVPPGSRTCYRKA